MAITSNPPWSIDWSTVDFIYPLQAHSLQSIVCGGYHAWLVVVVLLFLFLLLLQVARTATMQPKRAMTKQETCSGKWHHGANHRALKKSWYRKNKFWCHQQWFVVVRWPCKKQVARQTTQGCPQENQVAKLQYAHL